MIDFIFDNRSIKVILCNLFYMLVNKSPYFGIYYTISRPTKLYKEYL